MAPGPDDDEVGVPAPGDHRDLLGGVALEDLELGLDSGLLGHRPRGVLGCTGSVQVLAELVLVDGATQEVGYVRDGFDQHLRAQPLGEVEALREGRLGALDPSVPTTIVPSVPSFRSPARTFRPTAHTLSDEDPA